tara:strand:+ start:703 stop:1506 length:804 start_codon:yes stop_codon:yes gene_type:complete
MKYLRGYTIKPQRVTPIGEVIFTDGTNEMRANQAQCQAYGYTYDIASGTCSAFRYNTTLNRTISNVNNKFNGVGNSTQLGSNTIQINGTDNTTEGFNNNCFISGSNNTIANGVNNATIVGSNGTALRSGEFVIGTGIDGSEKSTFFLTTRTTSAHYEPLILTGDAAVTAIATLPDTLYIAEVNIYAYRTGGASGSGAAGDSAYFLLKGMINGTTITQSLTVQLSLGTVTGWTAAFVIVSDELKIIVTGAVNMEISWSATANFSAMKI